MITGFWLAISIWIVAIQVPYKELWVGRIWLVDLATGLLLVQVLFAVRSTSVMEVTTYAAVIFTLLIHIWAWGWRKFH